MFHERRQAETLPELMEQATQRFGPLGAVEDGATRLSFAELASAARRLGRALCAGGLAHGDRVAIWAPNQWEWIVAALGTQLVGGVLVPVNTRFKGAEAGWVLEKSGARFLFSVPEVAGTRLLEVLRAEKGGPVARRPVAGLPALEHIVCLRGEADRAEAWRAFLDRSSAASEDEVARRARAVAADDLLDVLFTSGTTGKPKGVMTTHAQNLRVFAEWSRIVGLSQGDRYLVVNPFFHAFGYKAGWLACLMRGATVVPQALFDAGVVLERIARDRISVLPGPPALYQTLLGREDLARFDRSCLRLAVTGAAVIPVELVRRMRDVLGFRTVITGYGLTESTGVVAMCRPDDDPETIATTSGRALPGTELACMDDAGRRLGPGEPGELVVRGYHVMKGYLDDPDATAEVIDEDGWLHTGDVGVLDDRGYVRITDRKKDLYIVGGFNCHPAEVEQLMLRHPAVAQVAVVGVPDARLGEVGWAFVVARPGALLEPAALIAWCRDRMANYKVPRRIEQLDALPLNAAGKVQKFVLRELAGARGRG
jgi:acyl-CoA synthetase (AMP-forming)/AMP-acid ligase II